MAASSTSARDNFATQFKQSRDWIVRTRRLARQLGQTLTATVRHWHTFASVDENTFATAANPSALYLSTIRATFKHLENLAHELESIRQLCDDYASDLNLHLNDEGCQDARFQARTAEYSQVLAIVMLCVIGIFPRCTCGGHLVDAGGSYPSASTPELSLVYYLDGCLDDPSMGGSRGSP
ncbi:hypothetical protein EDB81DRAFT_768993 [Dactylonectria macrodidyma]|uniref:Uncharacterized protein n=1 Tax=Dactylonectria macrodidyma TaxID=307937 RepID=A0A9P9D063_9HYPO|nr:hypothetical protein EDB81DRAFT_768993 [Dactylonectria macrodidyma]